MAASTTVEHVVVDAGGFIRQAPIREIGAEVYSIPQVIQEIHDKETKRRLQVLPYTLNLRNPTSEAIVFVSDFAKKTGDYKHLSCTDINVLALTYMLEKQYEGEEHIRRQPLNMPAEYVVPSKGNTTQRMAGFYMEAGVRNANNCEDAEDEDANEAETADAETAEVETMEAETAEVETIEAEAATAKPDTAKPDTAEAVTAKPDTAEANTADVLPEDLIEEEQDDDDVEEEEEEEDDDDEGWITPSNIMNVKRQLAGIGSAEKTRVTVACLTTDFAMQNVLIQMGLNVVSVEGMLIKQARSYVLRCYACMKMTYDTMKVFCPNCGNKTLKRVAMMRDEEGKVHYYFSRRPLNTRGTKFPLPQPKGGKYANNPYLCEDQPMPHQRPRKQKQRDAMNPDYIAGTSPFTMHDVSSRAATIGISEKHDFRKTAYWNKRNPNQSNKNTRRK